MAGRRTLLVTGGATPQVVTETVWALAQASQPWLPDEIILATTASGARIYREGQPERGLRPLLGAQGQLAALFTHLAGEGAALPPVAVLVPEADGQPVDDLRTARDVALFAEMLLARVAELTARPDGRLHVSLAGGRKTMSFVAGQVLSLLGRPQDVLSHVLVEPPELEFRPDFWWPGDGSPGSERARVRLHDVPYLRARAWVDAERVLNGPPGGLFQAAVERANLGLSEPALRLCLATSMLTVGSRAIRLAPQQAALLALIFVAELRGQRLVAVSDWDPEDPKRRAPAIDGDRVAGTQLWAWLAAAATLVRRGDAPAGPMPWREFDQTCRRECEAIDHDKQIAPVLSRLRRELHQRLPPALADRILLPRGLGTAYPPHRLRVLAPPALAGHPHRPPETEVAP